MLAIGLLLVPGMATAHLDPPGPPPILVTVWVTGAATTTDMDDGLDDNAEIAIIYTLVHSAHTVEKGEVVVTDNYDWDTYMGTLQPVGVVLYTHLECTKMNRITIVFEAEEESVIDVSLGHGGVGFKVPGVEDDTTVGGGTDNHATIEFTVTAVPQPDRGECRKR